MSFPSENPPTIGIAVGMFWTALVGWLTEVINNVPDAVEASGAILLLAIGAYVIGRFTQKHTDPKPTGGE